MGAGANLELNEFGSRTDHKVARDPVHAIKRRLAQALTHLRNATLYVQRALLAAGLVAPQPTGNPP